jgi:hypothetical protein
MRAIGFSEFGDRKRLKELLTGVIMNSDRRGYAMNQENVMLGEFCKDFADKIGIAVCGEFDENDKFIYDYYYPYLIGNGVTSYEDVSVERHASKDSYAGVCDEIKLGISLIFYLQNMIPYVKAKYCGQPHPMGVSVTMSALSTEGSILMPIRKDEMQKKKVRKDSMNRSKLIDAARKGDEEAIETLTLEDMDIYTAISKRIKKDDVFSLVDTYFMPYGVECDQYSILGEITDCHMITNTLTGEKVYQLTVYCNELSFDLCINAEDLFGEPAVGRRFKGTIWLQGFINFPE